MFLTFDVGVVMWSFFFLWDKVCELIGGV